MRGAVFWLLAAEVAVRPGLLPWGCGGSIWRGQSGLLEGPGHGHSLPYTAIVQPDACVALTWHLACVHRSTCMGISVSGAPRPWRPRACCQMQCFGASASCDACAGLWAYRAAWVYGSLCMAVFMVRTMKRVIFYESRQYSMPRHRPAQLLCWLTASSQ